MPDEKTWGRGGAGAGGGLSQESVSAWFPSPGIPSLSAGEEVGEAAATCLP